MRLAEAYFDERAAGFFPTSPMARMRRVCAADRETDDELMARLREAEALVTQLAAIQARDLAELRRRRLAEQGAAGLVGPQADEHGWLVPEVAVALGLSDRQAHARVDQAQALQQYESLALAMGMGAVQAWTAQRLVDHLDELAQYVSPERLQAAERSTVAWLRSGSRTVTALNARMRRLITRARADAGDTADDEVARRHSRRRISVTCERDGTASLFARLTEADGLALARALDERSRRPVDEDDQRTLAQRQADLLVAAVTGAPAVHGLPQDLPDHAAYGARAGVGVRLSVTVPLQSLVAGTEPATVPGIGTIPAATARQLAGADDVRARPVVYDAVSGRLLGIGQYLPASQWWKQGASRVTWEPAITPVPGYEHPSVMDEFIRTRDAVCRAPGCRRRAERCDCDHVDPYPQGRTSVENGCCLCRRHHRLKTHALGWRVDVSPDSTLTWTTPTGLTASTKPRDMRTEQERDVPPF